MSRNAKDRTSDFPRIAAAILNLQPGTLLLDGEVVVFDKKGVSRFQLLQQSRGEPVHAVFDCLYQNGKDLRREPLSLRRAAMKGSLDSNKILFPSRRLAENGLEAFKVAKCRGFEGVVAKDLSSCAYRKLHPAIFNPP